MHPLHPFSDWQPCTRICYKYTNTFANKLMSSLYSFSTPYTLLTIEYGAAHAAHSFVPVIHGCLSTSTSSRRQFTQVLIVVQTLGLVAIQFRNSTVVPADDKWQDTCLCLESLAQHLRNSNTKRFCNTFYITMKQAIDNIAHRYITTI